MRIDRISFAIALALFPALAAAHGVAAHDGFAAGALHSVTGWEHLLSALGSGVLAGILHSRSRRVIVGFFALILSCGAMLSFGITAYAGGSIVTSLTACCAMIAIAAGIRCLAARARAFHEPAATA